MKWKVIFLAGFVLLHWGATLLTLRGASETRSRGYIAAATVLTLPILQPLMNYDPDGDRLPPWFRLVSIPLNSLACSLSLLLTFVIIKRIKAAKQTPVQPGLKQ